MPAKPLTFRQRDLTAAIKAALRSGLKPVRAEIDKDGKIALDFGDPKPEHTERDAWVAATEAFK